ncbi:MAG: serine/threonine-protein phosphatase [Methanobrevibacter sp.]|nr:serine/threonine-protein phosphatase [Candidatus Methanovirga meridionalis]
MFSKIKLKSILIPIIYSLVKFAIVYYLFQNSENLLLYIYSPLFIVVFPLFYGIYGAIGLGLESVTLGLLIRYFQPGIIGIDTILLIAIMYIIIGIFVSKFWYKYSILDLSDDEVVNLSDDEVTPPYLFNIENTTKIFLIVLLTYFIAQVFVQFSLLHINHMPISVSRNFCPYYFFTLLIISLIFNILSVSFFTLINIEVRLPKMDSFYQLKNHIKEINVLIYIFLMVWLIHIAKIYFYYQLSEMDLTILFFNALIFVILIIIKPKSKKLVAFPYKTSLKEILVFIILSTTFFLGLLIIIFLSYCIHGKLDLHILLTEPYNIIIIFLTYFFAIYVIRYFDNNFTNPLKTVSQISHAYIHNKINDNLSSVHENSEKNTVLDIDTIKNELDELSSNGKFEVGELAYNIKEMINDLEYYINNLKNITRKKERRQYEIDISKGIQESMMPKSNTFPGRLDDFGIYTLFGPKEDVGGDFYGYHLLDDDHLIINIGDASGNGISAALFMIKINTMIQDYFDLNIKFERILYHVNNQLTKHNDNNMFASVFLGVLTISTGQFKYVNAGHEPPLLCKKNSKYEALKVDSGIVLGLKKRFEYPVYEIYLNEGDRLCLYTDGVTERQNINGERYTLERLIDFLNKNNSLNIQNLSLKFKKASDNFGNNKDSDDKTFLLLEYRHTPDKKYEFTI